MFWESKTENDLHLRDNLSLIFAENFFKKQHEISKFPRLIERIILGDFRSTVDNFVKIPEHYAAFWSSKSAFTSSDLFSEWSAGSFSPTV